VSLPLKQDSCKGETSTTRRLETKKGPPKRALFR